MRAAGIVADHAAQRAAAVGGGVGAESQAVALGSIAQCIADHTRFDQRRARACVDVEHAVHVLRGVDDDGDVHALAVLRSAAAAHQERHIEVAADFERGDHIVGRARQHHAKRRLTVIRGVARIERAAAGVEAHLAADARGERMFERMEIGGDRCAQLRVQGGGIHGGILTAAAQSISARGGRAVWAKCQCNPFAIV